MITINVTNELTVVDFTLPKGDVVVGELTSRPLELDEILARGIDPSDPDNQNMFEHSVELEFTTSGDKREKKTLVLVTTNSGDIVDVEETFNENWQVIPKTITSQNGKGSNGQSSKSIVLFSIYTDVSWMKEFYCVDLTVLNNADDNFTLENCTADLTLPTGLSLAKTERGEDTHINAGMITGGETKTMSWIVRGDEKGEYYMTAEFNCVLTPFMEDITLEFVNEKPLVVYGSDALKFEVDYTGFDPESDYWTAKFTLTNVTDKPIYDVNIDFHAYKYFDDIEISDMIITYPSGIIERIPWTGKAEENSPDYENVEEFSPALYEIEIDEIEKRTLYPNEYIIGYYSISNIQNHID